MFFCQNGQKYPCRVYKAKPAVTFGLCYLTKAKPAVTFGLCFRTEANLAGRFGLIQSEGILWHIAFEKR